MNKLKFLFNKYLSELSLGGILLLAAFLRLDHLSLRPLWLDEADIANLLTAPISHSWAGLISSTNNAAYFYILKTWSLYFGNSEGALRSLSVVFSLLSIIAIYRFGLRLRNKKTGLWAAFLLAVNYFSIFYAIQARQYSLVILLSILSYYYFYLLLTKTNFKNLFLYTIFTVLGIYSHPWFFLILMSQSFYLIFRQWRRIKRIIISQTIIFILSIPWLMVLWQYKTNGANSWIKLTTIKTFFSTFHYFMYGATGIYIIIGAATCLFIVGHFEETKTMINFKLNHLNYRRINPDLYLLFNYLFFPLFVAWYVGHSIPFYESGRYEAIVLPAFILLFAVLWARIKKKWLIFSLVLLLVIFSYREVINEKRNIQSQQINNRTVVAEFLTKANNGDWLVFTGLSRPPIDYYLKRINLKNKNFKEVSFPAGMAAHPAYQNISKTSEEYKQLQSSANSLIKRIKLSTPHRVWLVFTRDNPGGILLEKEFQNKFSLQNYLLGPYYNIILYKF